MKLRSRFILIALVLACFSAQLWAEVATSVGLEIVKLQLKWTHQFQFAGYYAAKEQGYYADAGLDVQFIERTTSINPVLQVTSGTAEYGIGASGLLLDRANGAPIKALAAIFQHNPLVFISKRSANIISPFEMHGKRIMFDSLAEEYAPLRALLIENGLSKDSFIPLTHTHNLDELISGKVDVISAYATSAPSYFQEQGLDINIINPTNYGIDFYGDILFTSEQELKNHPDRAQRFLRASLKGWRYALAHQEELVQLIHNKYPNQLSIKTLRNEAKETAKLIPNNIPLGQIKVSRLQRVAAIYAQLNFSQELSNKEINNFLYSNVRQIQLSNQEQAWLDQHQDLTFTGDPNWLPYEAFDKQGGYIGIVAEHLQLVEQQLGIKFNIITSQTWQESVAMVRMGVVDIISDTVDSNLRSELNFTKPYLASPIVIVMRQEQPYVDSIAMIASKKVALIKDYGYVHNIIERYPNLKYHWVNNIKEGLEAVSSGKVDALLSTLAHTAYSISESAISNIRIVGKTEFTNELALGVKKELAPLIPLLNRAFAAISAQHKKQIFDKWGSAKFAPKTNYRLIVQIAAGFLLLFIMVLTWNHKLQQQINARKQAEKALRASEQRFHSMFEDAPLGVALINSLTGKVYEINTQFTHIVGRSKSDIITSDWMLNIHNDDIQALGANLTRLHSGIISSFNMNNRYLKPDASIIWLNMTVSPLLDEDTSNPKHLCMIEDITASRAKDEVLRIFAESKHSDSNDMLMLITQQLMTSSNVNHAFIATINPQNPEIIDVLSALAQGEVIEKFSYPLQDTPCQNVINGGTYFYPEHLQQLFPKDQILDDLKLESYFGIPLTNSAQKVIGILAIFDTKPMTLAPGTIELLHSLAVRASIEIERTTAQEQLKKLSLAVKHSPSAVMITDVDSVIEYVNPKFTETTGYAANEILGAKPSLFKSDECAPEIYTDLWDTLLAGNEWRGELHNRKKNGDLYWAREFIAPITNDAGDITHFVAIQEDVTEAKLINEEMTHRATHDMLTGLINRAEFEYRLHRIIKTAQQDPAANHALCFLDLDQFKVVNDTSGHVAGDELLRQLGALLSKQVRQRDTLARIGGDEFAILMEHCGLEQAHRATEAIRKLIEDFQFNWENRSYRIGVSIGLTLINHTIKDASEALKHADLACYAAKDMGRNRVHTYHPNDAQLAKQEGELHWAARITEALENNMFRLYVQAIEPIAKPETKLSYEILLRLQENNGDIIPPGGFLPAIERYNLAHKVDLWVVTHAFQWIMQNVEQLHHIQHFAINLSGQSLGDEALLAYLIATFNEHNTLATKITFEITETAAISNLRAATSFIKVLKKHGCQFALDDFGSGLSSFAYLKNLPVDYLKIDGMFVKDILDDPIDHAMVRSINEIGHVMQIKTIAEFVENTAIKKQLEHLGVDFVQGYGIGKPFPIEKLLS